MDLRQHVKTKKIPAKKSVGGRNKKRGEPTKEEDEGFAKKWNGKEK